MKQTKFSMGALMNIGISTALSLSLSAPTFATTLKGFQDQDLIINQQAVDVVVHLGIMEGDDQGYFHPSLPVTRGEMAVICTTMLNGAHFPVESFAIENRFSDVPDWAVGYVNLANLQGIVMGDGDGNFRPDDSVTAVEALLMMLKTLGYFQSAEEYGSHWVSSVLTRAGSLGFFHATEMASASSSESLTRENVASYVFHAMTQVVPVDYNKAFGAYYNRGGSMLKGVDNSIVEDTLGYNFITYSSKENL